MKFRRHSGATWADTPQGQYRITKADSRSLSHFRVYFYSAALTGATVFLGKYPSHWDAKRACVEHAVKLARGAGGGGVG